VVYYNDNGFLLKDEVKLPIWFKRGADPKYVCYCSKVTEEDVINAVLKKGSRTISEVCEITGAMSKPECDLRNPTGKCCYNIFKEALNKALKILKGGVIS